MATYNITISELDSTLQNADANTPSTPHIINISEITQADVDDHVFRNIFDQTKYVIINILSGPTVTDASYLFDASYGTSTQSLVGADISSLTSAIKADGIFTKCTGLKSVDITGLNKVTSATKAFYLCDDLETVECGGLTSLLDASEMFRDCTALSEIDTSSFTNVTNAYAMFAGCTALTEINTSPFTNVTYAVQMFSGCAGLTEIDTSPFIHVTLSESMFANCTGLTEIDTSAFANVTSSAQMFANCTALTEIDTSAFANVTNAYAMFFNCSALEEIHGWSIPLSATMTSCFRNCDSLQAIYVPEIAPQESTWHAWEMSKDTANTQTAVKVYNLDGTSVSVNVPSTGTYTTKTTDKVDELLFASSAGTITSAMIQKMLQIKAPITGRESVLDPTKDNFVLWAKNQQEIKTNIVTNTVEANNPLPPSSAAVHAAIAAIGLAMYPVGSIYLSVNSTNPGSIFGGTWQRLPNGVFIRNAGGNAGTVGQTQAEGLPNITGGWAGYTWDNGSPSGAIASSISNYNQGRSGDSNKNYVDYRFDASVNGTTLYGKSSHVTPYNFCVYMWRRTA